MTTTETPTYSLHPDTGRFLVDGVQLPLQQKAQQVLSRIAASAPAMVLRHELIDEVWAGNYLTGEKGLRQALWAIRAALQDNATSPVCIRTIPRQGYQWIGAAITPFAEAAEPTGAKRFGTNGRAFIAIAILTFAAGSLALSWTAPSSVSASPVPKVAQAQLRNNSIVVDYTTGCRRILKPNSDQLLGDPVVSADRKQVLFRVAQKNTCRLLLFEPESDRISTFSSCADVAGQG